MLTISDIDKFLISKAPNDVDLLTLHWTVGRYSQTFLDDYHFQILGDGRIFLDPRAFDSEGNFVPLSHAWHHNSRNIGISLCAMLGALEVPTWRPKDLYDFPPEYGAFPPTQEQMNTMCQLVSKLVRHYGLPFDKIKTHYQLAQEDGYPGERWEFDVFRNLIVSKVSEIYQSTKPIK